MPDESTFPGWASDANYTSGSYPGSPTKVAPSAAEEAQGFVDGQSFHSGYANYHIARIESWLADTARAIYGDGSDGDVVITGGTTTLARDMYYDNLTVESTGVLAVNGFRVFVRGLLTIESGGIVHSDGTAGVGAAPGVSPTGSLAGGGQGGLTSLPLPPDDLTAALGGAGGGGGWPGGGGAGTSQSGGLATAPTADDGGYRDLTVLLTSNLISGARLRAGAGGGAGSSNGGFEGGGGGGGGGIVLISAFTMDHAGLIRAAGGNGGAGPGANTGGGGGGGGGTIIIVSRGFSGAGTFSMPAGVGGIGHGTGFAGAAGTAGTTVIQVTT